MTKSKNLIKFLCMAAWLTFTISCKKNDTNSSLGSSVPLRTMPGQPIGAAVKASIGANGGSISIPDQYISVQVPAGAVDAETEFSIQEIQPGSSVATGRLFRILPEGITLKKPVEITFKYTDADVAGTDAALLYPCFQSNDGLWHKVLDCTLDPAAKTLKVSTTHFSDWGILREVSIHAPKEEVGSNEEIELTAFILDEDVATGILIGSDVKRDQIVGWKVVAGGGTISGGKSTTVKYKAPDTDKKSEALIEVTVKNVVKRSDPKRPGSGGLVIVRRKLTIMPEEYVVWTIGGQKATGIFFSIGVFNGHAIMTATAGNEAISFHTNGTVLGKYSFGKLTDTKKATCTGTYQFNTYESDYTECETFEKVYGEGSIVFETFGESGGGIVQGSFQGTLYRLENCDVSARSMYGSFRIRRTY